MKLCLKMIVEHRTLISLTKNIARAARNNQHVTFSSIVAFCVNSSKRNFVFIHIVVEI